MKRSLVLGTRRSRLALLQTQIVRERLIAAFPGLSVELREIVTAGDRSPDRPLSVASSPGFFTREIERRLLSGKIDLAVHSLKDLPVDLPAGLVIAATPERGDPHDALLSRSGVQLAELEKGALVGTSSPRRRAQILAARSDLTVHELRGNVDTRIEKLRRGDYDAILVAKVALDRLECTGEIAEVLGYDAFLPAPAQGALAVEVRVDDQDVIECVRAIDHEPTRLATTAERLLLEHLGGGCHLPLGALAETAGTGQLRLRAMLLGPEGSRTIRADARGNIENLSAVVDKCCGALTHQESDDGETLQDR